MRVTVAGNAAEAKTGGKDTRSRHNAHIHQVTNGNAVAPNLNDGSQAMRKSIIGLLYGTRLLLSHGFDDPVIVVVGKIA